MKASFTKMFFLLLILNVLNIYGQGTLKGTVIDSLTADQIKGAKIILTGTNFNAVSDVNGEFYLSGIPAGEYILNAYYLAYNEKKILVTIKSGEILKLSIDLLPDIKIGNEISLSDQSKSQAEEINLQINSNAIKNVIAGKKLHDMPEENFPTSLSRLPGVSILYKLIPSFLIFKLGGGTFNNNIGLPATPEDNFPIIDDPVSRILIRGLDSKYSNITVDGIRIPPASATDKSIDLSIISDIDFKNIELNKNITSDEDADATAGSINLITGKAPNKRMIKAKLSGNYNRLDKSTNQYNFTGSCGERFFDNLLGVQVDVNAEKRIMSSEYQKYTIYGIDPHILSYTNSLRERYGANILLDFNTPDGGSIKFNNIFNKTNTEYFTSQSDSLFLFEHTDHTFYNMETEQKVFISSLAGNNYLLGFKVDWNAAFSESKNDHPFYFTLNSLGTEPYQAEMGLKEYLVNTTDKPSKNYNKEKIISINFSRYNKISNEASGRLKFGLKYRVNSKSYYESLHAENGSLVGADRYIVLADGTKIKKDFSGTRFDGLLGRSAGYVFLSYFQDDPPGERTVFDNYKITLINKDALRLWRQLNYGDYYSNNRPDINSYNFSESVLAGYVMYDLNLGKSAKFITGLRIESEQNTYNGYYFPSKISLDSLYNVSPLKTNLYHYNKTSLLPNFQMILKPADFLNLRLAAYKTLIRPDCSARIPKIFTIGADIDYLNMGNPDLKNADVWNYELQTQFYGKDLGMLSINAFYKDINGMPQETDRITLTGINKISLLGINWNSFPVNYTFGNTSSYNLYTYFNSPKPTHVWGFEIEHKANFRFLPGFLKNIVLNYNFTFLRSETWVLEITPTYKETEEYILSDHKDRFGDTPEFFANIILGYDIEGLSLRISYFYQDGYPILNNSLFNYQIRGSKFSRLDIAVIQQVLKKISIFLNLNNITNFKEEIFVKNLSSGIYSLFPSHDSLWHSYRYGMNVDFGIRIDL